MADEPEPGDRGELTGLRSRPDLNGRRVEVRGQAPGRDGAPRLAVRLLFGAGAGAVMKVKAANLELDRDRALGPAMATLVTAMQALAPGAAPEEWRDWAGGLPALALGKVAEKVISQTEAPYAARLKKVGCSEEEVQEEMAEWKRQGNCLFVFAMVCKEWRKAQLTVGGPLRIRARSDVIPSGQVALAKWALAEGCPRDNGDQENPLNMAHVAARQGQREIVQWLIGEQGFAMDKRVMMHAANGGNLELVQWLRGEGCAWGEEACSEAAYGGRLEVLRWLRANGCPWDNYVVQDAARQGHLEVMCWARENGCNWNAGACAFAAQYGHLEILQWLRENGCPWDHWTCYQAADQGHEEILRWARENGCEWDEDTRDRAAAELGYTDDLGNLVWD